MINLELINFILFTPIYKFYKNFEFQWGILISIDVVLQTAMMPKNRLGFIFILEKTFGLWKRLSYSNLL